jgi:hypothetical protein
MSVSIKACNKKQIVVPVRFARAVSGPAQMDAPDIDDRAFIMNRPPGLTSTDARGPMFAVTVGQSVRVKVVREDLDDAAPLFATVENAQPAQIEIPADEAGTKIPADGIIHVHGIADNSTSQRLQIRLGSVDGPVIAEAEPHVVQILTIPITPHLVTINSSTSGGTEAAIDINRVLRRVRAIWRACGIDFSIQATQHDGVTLPSNTLDTSTLSDADIRAIMGLQRKRLSAAAGAAGLAADWADQTINWYIIVQFSPNTVDGLGISRTDAGLYHCDPGIISTTDWDTTDGKIESVALATAHEIGHFFRLRHIQFHNADNPVSDSFGRRCLMFPTAPLPAVASPASLTALPRVSDVGYGNLVQGQFLGLKKHFNTDSELHTSRTTIRSNKWF